MTISQAERDQIVAIAREHGARSVRVFGSRARGEARPDSDLDLLVEMEGGRSLLDLIDLEQALERVLGVDVDVVTPGSLSPYIRDAVQKDAIPL